MLIEWHDRLSDRSNTLVANDRAVMFGDGFFTTGVIQQGILALRDYHLRRITESARRLMFNDLSMEQISNLIDKACGKQPDSIIRINISRVQSQRGYAISHNSVNKIQIVLNAIPEIEKASYSLIDSDISVSMNPSLAGIKHLNRIDSVLAASQLPDAQTEALMYHRDQLICGSKSNLFIYLDGVWQSPNLESAGVEGIMRQRVIDRMDKFGEAYKIGHISRAQLQDVRYAFITNCVIGIRPVCQINAKSIETEGVEKLKRKLNLDEYSTYK